MITEKQIEEIVNPHLEGTTLFLVEVSVRTGNRVFVYIDGDTGVTIDDCKSLSRFIEGRLDRETEDFDLTVSTSGADSPLRFPRQYPKHIGRTLEVAMTDNTSLTGKLVTADPGHLEIEPATGKKEPRKENITIAYDQIKEAKIKLSFGRGNS